MTEQKAKRNDRPCEKCGRPVTSHGHADVENGPHPSDCDDHWRLMCDDCEYDTWVKACEWESRWWDRVDARIVTRREAMTVIIETGDCDSIELSREATRA